jgi:hypothetical protein
MLWTLARQAPKSKGETTIQESIDTQAMAVLCLGKDFDARRSVLIDSGCTKSVFCNKDKLTNLREPEHAYVIHGVGGKLPVTHVGDFPVALKHSNGSVHVRLITGCLYAPDATANPLATVAHFSGYKCWVHFDPDTAKLYCTRHAVFDATYMPARTAHTRAL